MASTRRATLWDIFLLTTDRIMGFCSRRNAGESLLPWSVKVMGE